MEAITQNPNTELVNCILEDAYVQGYTDAMRKIRERNRARREQRERKRYFIKQRLYGLATLAFTVLAVRFLDGDATIALFTIPLGVSLLLSKQMLIVNNYYWEHEDEAEF